MDFSWIPFILQCVFRVCFMRECNTSLQCSPFALVMALTLNNGCGTHIG